jgi:hypothetical protein
MPALSPLYALSALDQRPVDHLTVKVGNCASGAGITVPGERKPLLDRLATHVVKRFARYVVAAKQAEYDELARSDLEWIAVRPAIVTDGPLTGRYICGPDALRPGARISRADVGHLMLAQAEVPPHVGHPGIFVRSA